MKFHPLGFLFLAIATFAQITCGSAACEEMYELSLSASGNYGGFDFAGSIDLGMITTFDNPIFSTFQEALDAGTGKTPVHPIARVYGSYVNSIGAGTWNLGFFDEHNSWISASFGFIKGPNVLIGGSGVYTGIVGSFSNEEVRFSPYILKVKVCEGSPKMGKKGKRS